MPVHSRYSSYNVMRTKGTYMIWTFVLVIVLSVNGNHNHWWKCSHECQRCVRRATPLQKWIAEYYSGLFSKVPPRLYSDQGTDKTTGSGISGIPYGHSRPINQGIYGNPGNLGYPYNYDHQSQYGCCETELGHWAPTNTTIDGKVYNVVHLKKEYQFIPVGRCRVGSTCQLGTCVQRSRSHWVLVYNNTKTVSAPVSFVPIRIPSHCECVNIGRARP